MATYFDGGNNNNNSSSSDIHHRNHESSAEGGGLQTLFLMNPNNNYVAFSSDTAQNPTPNMIFLNTNNSTTTSPHALNLASLSHAPPPQQQLIPTGNEISGFHGFVGPMDAPPRVHHHYNWGSIIDQASPSSAVVAATVTVVPSNNNLEHTVTAATTAEMGLHRPRGHEFRHHSQGLSLSLSSRELGLRSMHSFVLGSKFLKAAQELLDEAVNVGNDDNKGDYYSNNKEKMKGNNNNNVESTSGVVGGGDNGGSSGGGGENSGVNNNDINKQEGSELNTSQRQELQMKKSKLVTMLDEIEQRYKEYNQQMQIVMSSFEEAAGYGAARAYTSLALKTISKQFRCLKDAISLQIKATGKALGDGDCIGVKVEGSRLRFVDHHLRQQRALQQLGMVQHNAWRPQRGLPERAVSILRAWLFEHFLHPYPKDSDKVLLAKQTGLTRSQVSNWFINARVRLWKPMVEEMYLEEIKDQEHNNNNNENDDDIDTTKKKKKKLIRESSSNNNELWSSSSSQLEHPSSSSAIRLDHLNTNNQNIATPTTQIAPNYSNNNPRNNPHHEIMNSPGSILSVDMEMKPIRETNSNIEPNNNNIKFGIELRNANKDGYPLMASFGNENHGGSSGYGGSAFSMEDIGRFHQQLVAPRFHGNGVSLTLGLPPSENNNFQSQQGFLSSQNMHLGGGGGKIHHHHHNHETGAATNNNYDDDEFCGIKKSGTTPSSHSGTSYDHNNNIIDMQNSKR
ncbi:hypothetical protein PIB30_068092 [Stylosanthes scabra]|nr:hypothetical protein [Stylosanthes scabra]